MVAGNSTLDTCGLSLIGEVKTGTLDAPQWALLLTAL